MAELSTLARPYAKAAFEFACDQNALADWSKQLSTVALISQFEQVQKLLDSPSLTHQQQAEQFIALADGELNQQVSNFVQVMSSNDRLKLLPEVSALFETFKANREKSVDVTVDSAFELDEQTQQLLATALSKKLERDVNLNTTVNNDLLGGVVIRAADVVIDGSVRGRLAKLAEAMNS